MQHIKNSNEWVTRVKWEGFDWGVGLNPNTNGTPTRRIPRMEHYRNDETHDHQGMGVGDGRTLLTQLLMGGRWAHGL